MRSPYPQCVCHIAFWLSILDFRGHICLGVSLTQGELLLMLLKSRGTELVSYQVNWLIVRGNPGGVAVGAACNRVQPFHMV